MRVFVCEFVTGGGLAGRELPSSLAREGDMMLQALVKHLADLPAVTVLTTRDARLPEPRLQAEIRRLDGRCDPWPVWQQLVDRVDAVWPIAPESGGALERLSALALDRNRILLGSRPAAVRLAASKRQTTEALRARGIAAVSTRPLEGVLASGLPEVPAGWVVKPDDGAGAEDTLLFRAEADLRRWAAGRSDRPRFVVQPFLPGAALSLSFLCRDARAALLTCNRQDVGIDDGRFRYRGGVVGGREDLRASLAPISSRIAAALPDLWGYVGVDLVETPAGPVVLEINPRLTTSYVGLERALGINPAALVLQLLDRDPDAIVTAHGARSQRIEIDNDGG